jgi:DsbE subfamily thiol:disulfide oxidoreductase
MDTVKPPHSNQLSHTVFWIGAVLLAGSLIFAVSMRFWRGNPDFRLKTLDDNTINLSDYRGQVVVLNFWATWCLPCKEEMPDLEAVYQLYKEDNLIIIGVNVYETADDTARFVRELGVSFPIALDDNGRVAHQFGVSGLPVTVVIGKSGQIEYRHTGQISRGDLIKILSGLLQK